MEKGLTKNQILSELSRSPHGKLTEYVPVGKKAAETEAEFLAHLIAWDHQKGQVRDAKVALPIVSLSVPSFPDELADNSFAHLALLGPRELLRAYRFSLELRCSGRMRAIRRVVSDYLHQKESVPWAWDRIALQHKKTLKELYALSHTKPGDHACDILFKGGRPKGSLFEVVANLQNMSPQEAAGTIMEKRIPFLIALGALGKKAKEPDLVLALIKSMSPTELVTNTKMLEKLGMKTNQALKGAFEAGLSRVATSKANILKTTRAAEQIQDASLRDKLRGVQDKQLATIAVDGNWLVLGDKSGSMAQAIEVARSVSATLAKMVKGSVHLVFFDTTPTTIDVTGMSLDAIQAKTKYVTANGGTSIGCGLQRMLDSKVEVDGIAVVSDGGENSAPVFAEVYKKYSAWSGKEVPVYLYHCDGDSPAFISNMRTAGLDLQVFDLTQKVDYYSLPNLVATMRTNRYSLVDEVMATKLLTLKDVLIQKKEVVA